MGFYALGRGSAGIGAQYSGLNGEPSSSNHPRGSSQNPIVQGPRFTLSGSNSISNSPSIFGAVSIGCGSGRFGATCGNTPNRLGCTGLPSRSYQPSPFQ